MKILPMFASVLLVCTGAVVIASDRIQLEPCWCWPGSFHILKARKQHSAGSEYESYGSYGSETDWTNPQRVISLNYQQAEGKRVFYAQCVWCHADSTPAGPSNRSNVSPDPPLMNDGAIFNAESDATLRRIIVYGGRGVGKSAMMPPYGLTLKDEEIESVIAYIRAIAVPEYRRPSGKAFLSMWRKP